MKFYPTFYLRSIYEITPQFLEENGISALILDVDNTLISNTVTDPNESVRAWVDTLKANGISLCIVSNGKGGRVTHFNKTLGLPIVYQAKKPMKRGFMQAISAMGVDASCVAAVGDQIFTDVWGASRCGLKSILVEPIDPFEQTFIKFKRVLEKPIIKCIKAGRRGK